MKPLLNILSPLLFATVAVILTGCASINTQLAPNTDLSTIKTVYVVRLPADERGVNREIADQLSILGYQATTGEAADQPGDIDVVITYEDKWMWDITMYMIELQIHVRNPENNIMMASAKSYRPSLQRKSVDDMVRETLESLLKQTS